MSKFRSRDFYCRIYGDYALFTDPATKGGGEKFSYHVPTYQALKGIVEAVYWKPTLYMVIDEVIVIKPIQTQTKGISALDNFDVGGNRKLNYYTFLKDVEYYVKFYFRWNENRKDLIKDRNQKKHEAILERYLNRGGKFPVFLGVSECMGYVEPLSEEEYTNANSEYKDRELSLGMMFQQFLYPSETGEEKLYATYDVVNMNNGKIRYRPSEILETRNIIGDYNIRNIESIRFVDEEYKDINEELL